MLLLMENVPSQMYLIALWFSRTLQFQAQNHTHPHRLPPTTSRFPLVLSVLSSEAPAMLGAQVWSCPFLCWDSLQGQPIWHCCHISFS